MDPRVDVTIEDLKEQLELAQKIGGVLEQLSAINNKVDSVLKDSANTAKETIDSLKLYKVLMQLQIRDKKNYLKSIWKLLKNSF